MEKGLVGFFFCPSIIVFCVYKIVASFFLLVIREKAINDGISALKFAGVCRDSISEFPYMTKVFFSTRSSDRR